MLEFFGAFLAGVLTTLAPCVLPLLPVIVGGSLGKPDLSTRTRALVITASLAVSVFAFSLLLQASTALIAIPFSFWQWFSGLLLVALGLFALFPKVWDSLASRFALRSSSDRQLARAKQKTGYLGAVLTGAALGPVFTSCSPFYLFIIVTVIPSSFAAGVLLLLAYVAGLSGTLLLLSLLGQKAIGKAKWIANPEGWFKRVIGIAFILVGLAIILGLDKDLQVWVLENSFFRPWELDANFIPNQ